MSDDYATALHRLREAEARTDAARAAYVAAMAAEAEARAPIKNAPAVLPDGAMQDGLPKQRRGAWGVSDDLDVLKAEHKTLIARTEEMFDQAVLYKTMWASQVEKQQSLDGIN